MMKLVKKLKQHLPFDLITQLGIFAALFKFFTAFVILAHWSSCLWRVVGEAESSDATGELVPHTDYFTCEPGGVCSSGVYRAELMMGGEGWLDVGIG